MAAGRHRVLVTGAAGQLGGAVVAALAGHPDVGSVVGVDASPSPVLVGQTLGTEKSANVEFVRVDLRSPTLARVVADSGADAVVHMGVVTAAADVGGRAAMKEINVVGTMHVLAACRKAPTLRRLVVQSSAGVYGSGPEDGAIFTEETEATRPPRSGWARDCIDLEAGVRGFARHRRDVPVVILRFAHGIGPALHTGFTDLFTMPAVPSPLGRDARLQFVHVQDIVSATVVAVLGQTRGVVNVAGEGVLPLSAAAAVAGRPVLGLPVGLLRRLTRFPGTAMDIDLTEDDLSVLSYGRVLDTSRAVRDLGHRPGFTTAQAFADFIAARGVGPLGRLRGGIDEWARGLGAHQVRAAP